MCGTKRSNCGHVDIGLLHSACWFVRYSVTIVVSVTLLWELGGGSVIVRELQRWVGGASLITVSVAEDICFCKERCEELLWIDDVVLNCWVEADFLINFMGVTVADGGSSVVGDWLSDNPFTAVWVSEVDIVKWMILLSSCVRVRNRVRDTEFVTPPLKKLYR